MEASVWQHPDLLRAGGNLPAGLSLGGLAANSSGYYSSLAGDRLHPVKRPSKSKIAGVQATGAMPSGRSSPKYRTKFKTGRGTRSCHTRF